jgi:uncharacterized protein YdhG (YjbR/CyaY superfamily)
VTPAKKTTTARKKPTTIDEYLAPLPTDQRAALQHIRELVHTIAPDATETISYDMPSFKVGGKGVIWFGAAAAHCALYGVPAELCAEVPAFDSSGKGTLRFTPARPLPDDFVRKVVQSRLHKNSAGTT